MRADVQVGGGAAAGVRAHPMACALGGGVRVRARVCACRAWLVRLQRLQAAALSGRQPGSPAPASALAQPARGASAAALSSSSSCPSPSRGPPAPSPRPAGHLQEDPPRQAGHDVFGHPFLGNPPRVQEVHARRAYRRAVPPPAPATLAPVPPPPPPPPPQLRGAGTLQCGQRMGGALPDGVHGSWGAGGPAPARLSSLSWRDSQRLGWRRVPSGGGGSAAATLAPAGRQASWMPG